MDQSELEREIEQDIYGFRLLVLTESAEGFRQVLLDADQFKKVSDAIIVEITSPKDEHGIEEVRLRLGNPLLPSQPFEGMRDLYPQSYLEQADQFSEDDL